MMLLDEQEVAEWVSFRGIEKQKRKLVLKNGYNKWLVIEMPEAARERIFLSGDLLMLGGNDDKVTDLIWISTWKIWSAWNDEFGELMITRLRSGGNAITPLNLASGQLMEFSDRMLSTGILWQTMLSNWDVYLVSSYGDYVIESSHDELIWIMSRTEAAHNRALDQLAKWKPSTRSFVSA